MDSVREYLESCMPTQKHVDDFVNPEPGLPFGDNNLGWTFDGELGWVLKDSVRCDGVDDARTFYHYEPSGARRRVNCPEGACRIRTYGNSFTHCDQVSDGETWQEYLSAHFGEPLENYGVGGYGVYQAYLRMRRVEAEQPPGYIILNIYCDDHFRNLDAWRTIRFGRRTACGFPLPHVTCSPETCEFVEHLSATPTIEDVHRLTDIDWLCETYADDPILQCVLEAEGKNDDETEVPVSVGLPHASMLHGDGVDERAQEIARQALYASSRIVELAEALVEKAGSKLMVVLSHSGGVIKQALEGLPYWDQWFVDYLSAKEYPILDTRDAHVLDHAMIGGGVDEYLRRYYIGHYSPAGNFFLATLLRRMLVEWIAPKPPAYRD
jgi:hypothetical protein